jgi:hypothetical protein
MNRDHTVCNHPVGPWPTGLLNRRSCLSLACPLGCESALLSKVNVDPLEIGVRQPPIHATSPGRLT